MKQRIQVTFLLIVIAAIGLYLWPQLMSEESLLGPRGERARGEVPFQASEVPVIGLATPGPINGETFERERADIFRYEEDPVARRERERLKKLKDEEDRMAREAKDKKDREERARLAREKAERDRLAREEAARLRREAEANRPPDEPPPPVEPPRPVPPDFPYRYDGLVGPRADAIAILRDKEDDFAYARAGQILDESFRIEQVGRFKLVLSYVDPLFEGEFEQIPLRPDGGKIGTKPTVRR